MTRSIMLMIMALPAALSIVAPMSVYAQVVAADEQLQELKPCGEVHGPLVSTQIFSLPPSDRESAVEVGESMVSTFKIDVMEGASTVSFNGDVSFPGEYLGRSFDVISPNVDMRVSLNDIASYRYIPPNFTFTKRGDATPSGLYHKGDLILSLEPATNRIIATLDFGFVYRTFPTNAIATKSTSENCTSVGVESFRRELIYSGVSQGTISLLYREFLNDFARPAFSQELHYDLKDGSEIGYKGARFIVIKASNSEIRYKVLKPLQ